MASEVKITLEDYLKAKEVNPGLVASFKYEASKNDKMLEPKTEAGWDKAFEAQSNKEYK